MKIRTLPIGPEELTKYPSGLGLHSLATTSTPAPRAFKARVTSGKKGLTMTGKDLSFHEILTMLTLLTS